MSGTRRPPQSGRGSSSSSTRRPSQKTTSGGSGQRRTRRRGTAAVVSPTRRLRVLIVVVAIVFSFVGARAVQIQVFNGKAVAAQAATDMTVARSVPAVRGTITGRDGSVLALTEATVNVVADPKRISTNGKEASTMTQADRDKAASAPADMAAIIAPALGLDKAEVETKLRKTDSQYQLLAKQVAASTWSALNATLTERGFLGITRESNPSRVYPYLKAVP